MSYNRDEAMRWYIEALRLNKADYCRAEFAVDLAFKLRDAVAEIDRLRQVCGETYQAFGAICGNTDQCVRVLDNLSDAAAGDPPRHKTVLPFLDEPAARSRYVGGRDVSETQRFGGRQTLRQAENGSSRLTDLERAEIAARFDDECRIDVVGHNGPTGDHYDAG